MWPPALLEASRQATGSEPLTSLSTNTAVPADQFVNDNGHTLDLLEETAGEGRGWGDSGERRNKQKTLAINVKARRRPAYPEVLHQSRVNPNTQQRANTTKGSQVQHQASFVHGFLDAGADTGMEEASLSFLDKVLLSIQSQPVESLLAPEFTCLQQVRSEVQHKGCLNSASMQQSREDESAYYTLVLRRDDYSFLLRQRDSNSYSRLRFHGRQSPASNGWYTPVREVPSLSSELSMSCPSLESYMEQREVSSSIAGETTIQEARRKPACVGMAEQDTRWLPYKASTSSLPQSDYETTA